MKEITKNQNDYNKIIVDIIYRNNYNSYRAVYHNSENK